MGHNNSFKNKIKENKYFTIFFYFILSRIILIAFLIANDNLSILRLYDSAHYISIASTGYSSDMLYAFFPLYPLLIKIFHVFIHSYSISGFIH